MRNSRETLWFDQALLEQGWRRSVRLTLAAGQIVRIETETPPAADDERHAIGFAGMPNLHSHAFQRGMAGRTEARGDTQDSFWSWREVMYRFVDRMGPDEVEAIAAFAYVEMLEAGFTRVGEFHYLHHDPDGRPYADPSEMAARIAAAADATGIGLTLLPVFYAHAGFDGLEPNPGQRRFIHGLEGFARLLERSQAAISCLGDAVLGLAPHSLRAVTHEELTALVAMAGGGPIHIHVAEQTQEVVDCLTWSGQRPVDWLLSHIDVNRNWCLVHATHMTPDELARVAASRAVTGLCPITEANLGDGVFPAGPYFAAGGVFGVGSDSNVLIDPAQELRQLEYSQRLAQRARNICTAADGGSVGGFLYRGAVAGGRQALGQTPATGLREGMTADVVSLTADHPALTGCEQDGLLDSWIFAARGSVVGDVWRAGEKVVEAGRHRLREPVVARFHQAMARLLG